MEYIRSALNTYLSSLQIQKFYNTYVSSQLHLDLFVCAAVIYFLLAYIRRQIKAIRGELRQTKYRLRLYFAALQSDSKKPMLSKPVLEVARREFLRAERAERLFDRVERRSWWRRLGSFDRKDSATAQGLFQALGQKGAAASQVNGSARQLRRPPSQRHRQGVLWGSSARETRDMAARSRSASGSRVSPASTSGRKGKIASSKAAFTWNRFGVDCDLWRLCYLWFAAKLVVAHHEKPGDRRSYLSC